MPIEYVLPAINGDHRNVEPTRVLITIIIELEKLQENKLEVKKNVGTNQWNKFLWSQYKNTNKIQIWRLCFMVSQGKRHTWENSRKEGLIHLGCNIAYPIILLFFLLMLIILNQI